MLGCNRATWEGGKARYKLSQVKSTAYFGILLHIAYHIYQEEGKGARGNGEIFFFSLSLPAALDVARAGEGETRGIFKT